MTEQVKEVSKGRPPKMLIFGVDVSDPENPKYRAMQVDQYGRLVLNPTLPARVSIGDVLIKNINGELQLRDLIDSEYRDLKVRSLVTDLQNTIGGSGRLAFQDGAKVRFAGEHILYALNDTPAYAEIGHVYNGPDYRLEVSRIGNIVPAKPNTYAIGSLANVLADVFTYVIEITGAAEIKSTAFLDCTLGSAFMPLSDVAGIADASGKFWWDDANQDLYIYSNTTSAWEKVHLA